jgi:hypothetical protein
MKLNTFLTILCLVLLILFWPAFLGMQFFDADSFDKKKNKWGHIIAYFLISSTVGWGLTIICVLGIIDGLRK